MGRGPGRLPAGSRSSAGFLPYDLNTPLFSDYAHKLRAVWLPPGTQAKYDADSVFDLPVGTIISKTFYYPKRRRAEGAVLRTEDNAHDFSGEGLDLRKVRLIETRLLDTPGSGWDALDYVWDDAQKEAHLEIAGDMKQLRIVSRTAWCIRCTTSCRRETSVRTATPPITRPANCIRSGLRRGT